MQPMNLKFVLVLLGVAMCSLAAFGAQSQRVNFGWLGMALFGLAWLISVAP
jgi:hypothetical protein